MTHTEYRAALEALDLSQVGGATLLGVDARTSRRWAKGDRKVPTTVEHFLSFLIAAKIKPDKVLALRAKATG